MSIQRRLAISITLVLLLSLILGCGLTYEHVISKVRTELQAAVAVGSYAVLNSVDDKAEVADPAKKLLRIVAEFNGDRHLKARLVASNGTLIAQSHLLKPEVPPPAWFYSLVAGPAPTKTMTLPAPFGSIGTLSLEADPHNEIAEAWSDARLTLIIMAAFFSMVLALAVVTIKAALAPIREVREALQRIGSGDYSARIDPKVAYELAPLRDGFNAMAMRLDEMSLQNRALNEQVMTLQEEERSELARDLHDEVAPFLFAVGADAAMMRQFLAKGAHAELGPRAEAIADAVKHMQRHLKDVLRRLTPGALLDLGLAGAIENLAGFWKTRRPNVEFDVEVGGEPLDPPLDAVAFRIVQESISNAIRHGRPSRIDIVIDVDDEIAKVVVEDDGTGFPNGAAQAGFGLTGMQERARGVGGTVSVRNRATGRGVIVEAVLPLAVAPAAQDKHKMDIPA